MIISSTNTIFQVLNKFNKKESKDLTICMAFTGKIDVGIIEELKMLKSKKVNISLITRYENKEIEHLFDSIYLSDTFHSKYIRNENYVYIGSSNFYKSKMHELGVFMKLQNKVLELEENILYNSTKIK